MDNFKTIHYGFKVVIHDYEDELTPLYNLLKKQSTNLEGSKLFDELIDIHEKLAKKNRAERRNKGMKLYELTQAYNQVLEMAEDLDTETLQDTLDSIREPIKEKAENIIKMVKSMDAEADGLAKEAERLTKRKKSARSKSKKYERVFRKRNVKSGYP